MLRRRNRKTPIRHEVTAPCGDPTCWCRPAEREPAEPETVHYCPPDGTGLTPCCNLPMFELPRTDRVTLDPEDVTCRRDHLLPSVRGTVEVTGGRVFTRPVADGPLVPTDPADVDGSVPFFIAPEGTAAPSGPLTEADGWTEVGTTDPAGLFAAPVDDARLADLDLTKTMTGRLLVDAKVNREAIAAIFGVPGWMLAPVPSLDDDALDAAVRAAFPTPSPYTERVATRYRQIEAALRAYLRETGRKEWEAAHPEPEPEPGPVEYPVAPTPYSNLPTPGPYRARYYSPDGEDEGTERFDTADDAKAAAVAWCEPVEGRRATVDNPGVLNRLVERLFLDTWSLLPTIAPPTGDAEARVATWSRDPHCLDAVDEAAILAAAGRTARTDHGTRLVEGNGTSAGPTGIRNEPGIRYVEWPDGPHGYPTTPPLPDGLTVVPGNTAGPCYEAAAAEVRENVLREHFDALAPESPGPQCGAVCNEGEPGCCLHVESELAELEPAPPYAVGDEVTHHDKGGTTLVHVIGCDPLPTGGWLITCQRDEGAATSLTIAYDATGRPYTPYGFLLPDAGPRATRWKAGAPVLLRERDLSPVAYHPDDAIRSGVIEEVERQAGGRRIVRVREVGTGALHTFRLDAKGVQEGNDRLGFREPPPCPFEYGDRVLARGGDDTVARPGSVLSVALSPVSKALWLVEVLFDHPTPNGLSGLYLDMAPTGTVLGGDLRHDRARGHADAPWQPGDRVLACLNGWYQDIECTVTAVEADPLSRDGWLVTVEPDTDVRRFANADPDPDPEPVRVKANGDPVDAWQSIQRNPRAAVVDEADLEPGVGC